MKSLWRNRVVLLVAAITAVSMSAVAASAADIGPLSSRMFSAAAPVSYPSAERAVSDVALTTTGAPATVSSSTITVTGSTLSTLNGKSVTLYLLNSSNSVVTSAVATLATGGNLTVGATTATITLAVAGSPSASAVTGWAVFIAGVQVLNPAASSSVRNVVLGTGTFPVIVTTWEEILVQPGNPNTHVDAVVLAVSTASQQCVTIQVSTPGPGSTPVAWSLTFDYAAGPFWGKPPSQIQKAQIQSTSGTIYTLVGTNNGSATYDDWGNNRLLVPGQTLNVSICQYTGSALPDRPEAYTVSAQFIPTPWTSSQACVAKTVTGNNTYPFFFGWKVTLDTAAAFAHLRTTDAVAPRAMSYTGNTVSPGFSGAVTSYTVANNVPNAISGTGSYVAQLCFTRY